ncbi:MAG: AAA family ATPase [Succinatimonas sp.]|nr:AAA family ATPase [Succinatimonas sp.]
MSDLLPIKKGISDFENFFIETNTRKKAYYVDKTAFLKDLLKGNNQVSLFTRPRRFGKSTTLSMIKTFLEVNYDSLYNSLSSIRKNNDLRKQNKFVEIHQDASSLNNIFGPLNISKEKDFCQNFMGQFPVISVSFKDVFSSENIFDSFISLAIVLGDCASVLSDYKESFPLYNIKEDFVEECLNLRNDFSLKNDNAKLIELLINIIKNIAKVFHHHVILLIDEYDVPIERSTHTIKKLEANIEVLKRNEGSSKELDRLYEKLDLCKTFKETYIKVLSKTLKDTDKFVHQAFVTGCLRVAKESIFTGLNNFVPIDFNDPRFNCLFGFTENEVKTMLNYYDQEYSTTKLFGIYKEWYDGYHFGSAEIYCPWDVLNFTDQIIELNDLTPKAFWIGTSSNLLPQDVFNDNPDLYVDNFETLIHGGSIEVKKDDFLNYNQLSNSKEADHFWNLLYATGYLTVAKDKTPSNDKNIVLTIPNHCVKECLEDLLKWCFTKSNPKFSKYFHPLIDALYEGNCRKITKILDDTLNRYISFYDYGKNSPKEMYYQGFINGIFSEICQSDARAYDYLPNVELGKGRADAVFYISPEDFDAETVGIVLELKVAKDEGSKKQFASLALDQIEEKEYAISYLKKDDSLDKVKYFGIAFFGKKCQVVCKEIKR